MINTAVLSLSLLVSALPIDQAKESKLGRARQSVDTSTRSHWPIYGYSKTSTPTFDIPLHDDARVQKWIRHFQGRGQARFGIWMARAARAAPLYYEVLRERKLPLDTLFLSMIESGFSKRAVSWASAAGPWQFMPRTGQRFELEYSDWVDERLNVDKATVAAARYLGWLNKKFGDWHLAWAAYNAGEARILRGLRRSKTNDYWALSKTRHLPRETREYVPKLIAAAIVSKSPERFGLRTPKYLDPIASEVVTVTVATDLNTIARACGGDVGGKELAELNTELYRGITPPGRSYDVKVPKYWARDCKKGLGELPVSERKSFRFHRIRKGESLQTLAKRYQTKPSAILAHNKITRASFSKFEAMVIPIPLNKDRSISIPARNRIVSRVRLYTPDSPPVRIHRVRRGDSLWKIARRYRVSIRKLRRWNGMYRNRYLRIGERLLIRRRG